MKQLQKSNLEEKLDRGIGAQIRDVDSRVRIIEENQMVIEENQMVLMESVNELLRRSGGPMHSKN